MSRLLSSARRVPLLNARSILSSRPYSSTVASTPKKPSSGWQGKVALLIGGVGVGTYVASTLTPDGARLHPDSGRVKPVVRRTALSDFPHLHIPKAHYSQREKMEYFVKKLQRDIVVEISKRDGNPFWLDSWTREEGGEGMSCVLQDGAHFDKAGVNVSVIHGKLPKGAIDQMRARGHTRLDAEKAPYPFYAAGISLVIHPKNPHAPTVHANFRYFEVDVGDGEEPLAWFGGGSDLTPSYLSPRDATHFHRTIKTACDAHKDIADYEEWKKWCDRYFYIPHRGEGRGIGGIFFDDVAASPEAFEAVKTLGEAFLPSYLPILDRRYQLPYTLAEKEWQQIRRGRYVEFNLVNDRGTKFGLQTPGARIESILMSLPLTARWEYRHAVAPGSREEALMKVLREPVDWAGKTYQE